ncbi:MAG TPA: hypothetical protein VGH29_00960 [Candidatus Binataceae bacterium]|jgi:hypothetical protein
MTNKHRPMANMVRRQLKAEASAVIVLGAPAGSDYGFDGQDAIARRLPEVLRHVADLIEADLEDHRKKAPDRPPKHYEAPAPANGLSPQPVVVWHECLTCGLGESDLEPHNHSGS